MHVKQFDAERRKEYLAIPNEVFFDLVKSLPPSSQIRLRAILPPAKARGFRPEHDQTLREQIKQYKEYLTQGAESGKWWSKAAELWIEWVKLVPPAGPTTPTFYKILEAYDNGADFTKDERIPANSKLDVECFEYLRQASERYEVDRETVFLFYRIGHFRADPQIEATIAKCFTRSQVVDHHAVFVRLTNLEEQVGPLSEVAEDFANTVAKQNEDIAGQESLLKRLSDRVSALEKVTLESKTALDSARGEIKYLRDAAKEVRLEQKSVEEVIDYRKIAQAVRDSINIPKLVENRVAELIACEAKESEAEKRPKPAVNVSRKKAPPYPSENEFVSFLAYCLQAHGFKDTESLPLSKCLYASLLSGGVSIASHPQIFAAVAAAINSYTEMQKFVVEAGWFSPTWIDNLFLRNQFVASIARGAGTGAPSNEQDMTVLAFEDFDRSLPEAYLLSAIKNFRTNGSTLPIVLLARCGDEAHVVPSHNFLRFACDLDPLLVRPESRKSSIGTSVCGVSTEQWKQWGELPGKAAETFTPLIRKSSEILTTLNCSDVPGALRLVDVWMRVASRHLTTAQTLTGAIVTLLMPCIASLGGKKEHLTELWKIAGLTDVAKQRHYEGFFLRNVPVPGSDS